MTLRSVGACGDGESRVEMTGMRTLFEGIHRLIYVPDLGKFESVCGEILLHPGTS